ncbi:hypothetical protein ACFQ0Q_24140 [Streptomyces aureus]
MGERPAGRGDHVALGVVHLEREQALRVRLHRDLGEGEGALLGEVRLVLEAGGGEVDTAAGEVEAVGECLDGAADVGGLEPVAAKPWNETRTVRASS